MPSILKKILIGLAGLIVLCVLATPLLPGSVHVERSIVIAAPQANLFELLNGYARFNDWSPWQATDGESTFSIEGPASGVGARMTWSGEEFGEGSQTITAAIPHERIEVALDFGTGSQPTSYLALAPADGGTQVTWGFQDQWSSFDVMNRWFGLLMSGFIGDDYARGLERLKTLAESLPPQDIAGLDVSLVDTQPFAVVLAHGVTTTDPADFVPAVAGAFKVVEAAVARAQLPRLASPVRVTFGLQWDEAKGVFEYEAAIPVAVNEATVEAPLEFRVLTGQRAVRATHRGDPAGTADVHAQIAAWLAVRGLSAGGPVWEATLSAPEAPPEAQVTEIYYPLR